MGAGGARGPGGTITPARIHGVAVDREGRCRHWRGATDVVAIRFPCCDRYFACHACHEALADHPAGQWDRADFDRPAVLCGACGTAHTIRAYLSGADRCPACGAGFNPRCRLHHPLYFQG
ncbi:MAG: CHY zinc finger protein [Longimicrobiales bacterium]|nr:CHY zinc finger protein [Longimicrobiales bacterium]